MAKPTVLVTGATGFIGSHLVRLLLQDGDTTVVANNVSGSTRHLEDVRDDIVIERADVGSFTSVLRMIEKHRPATIFHIRAMLAPACDGEPETGLRVNGLGTYHILEAARLFGVGQVVFASSASVITGASATQPTVDDFSVTRPDFIYGAAKLLSENVGLFFKRQYGLDYRALRLPNVIGPGALTHGCLEYFNKAIEETAHGRPYSLYVEPHVRIPVMYVDDAARAFVELARAPLSAIKTVNYTVLGPTPSPTAQELVDTLRSRVPGAQLDFTVDPQVSSLIESVAARPYEDLFARREWGWQHRFGVAEMVDDFLAAAHPGNASVGVSGENGGIRQPNDLR